MTKPLEGVRVVDLTYYVAGPGTAKILADWGADVIKIEPPGGEPGRVTGRNLGIPSEDDFNPYFGIYNSNKRDVILNLKDPRGLTIMDQLLEKADVFVTSFRPGALRRLGLDYETMSKKHPKIIWASINGFGEKGPDKDRPGFDTVAYWARSGAMLDLTERNSPPLIPTLAFGDANTSGSLAGGICAALYRRNQTGKGTKVMVSLFGQALWNLASVVVSSQFSDGYPKTRIEPSVPMVNSYETGDGKWVFITIFEDRLFPPFLEKVVGSRALAQDSRYNTTLEAKKHSKELTEIIAAEFSKHTQDEMVRRLIDADIAHERINHVADILRDPQAVANDYIIEFAQKNGKEVLVAQPPVKMDTTECSFRFGVPAPGEHTGMVLEELGYTKEKIQELKDAGIVKQFSE